MLCDSWGPSVSAALSGETSLYREVARSMVRKTKSEVRECEHAQRNADPQRRGSKRSVPLNPIRRVLLSAGVHAIKTLA